MSLRNITAIDMVIRRPGEPSRTALLIHDNGEIADEQEREEALRRKLAAYLLFVQSGQFAAAYPDLVDTDLTVEVVCSVPPTDAMRNLDGVSHPENPEMFLPVKVRETAEFRAALGL